MKIDREKFLSAVIAVGMTGAVACGGEEPAPAEAEPAETTGAEEVAAEPAAAAEEAAPEAPAAPEPEPEVEETGPTPE